MSLVHLYEGKTMMTDLASHLSEAGSPKCRSIPGSWILEQGLRYRLTGCFSGSGRTSSRTPLTGRG
jgi:hypothetical protein